MKNCKKTPSFSKFFNKKNWKLIYIYVYIRSINAFKILVKTTG